MGLFNDSVKYYYNNNLIEVEARTTFGEIEYNLILNNSKIDTIKGFLGNMTLRGNLTNNNTKIPFIIRIKQSVLGAKYFLEINDNSFKMI